MTGKSDYTAKNDLNYLAGAGAPPDLTGGTYLALFTAVGTDANTGFTEVSGGAYARAQISGQATTNGATAAGNATLHFASTPAWIVAGMTIYDKTASSVIPAGTTVLSVTGTTVVMSANATGAGVGGTDVILFSAYSTATGSAPSQIASGSAISFPQSTASWGTVIAWGVYDAATSGNLLYWDYLGNYSWLPAEISSASPGVITAKAHGYAAADSVMFSTEYGGTAPSFSQSNLTGILAVVSPATDTFTVTNASTAVNTSSTGSGMVRKLIQQPIPINTVYTFASGNLIMTAA
ncbi:hypothetical protein QM467_04810 [Rhodoblastus sp. 17X3]|uniref:phage tail fiber protein n=1 Tax=Rhodoblastus sp. 17X3 TaxID=3047026 RepID=UPI0024B6F5DF|nr:hypothetical protein [Rhodoblastus sp. 17X3]MDI9847381.1 hypothetical protein [Rhodoblastus sp. 17X3]